MELLSENHENDSKWMDFHGRGAVFFGIIIVNFILTILTLGFYYPWAKEKIRKYIWSEIEFEDSRFAFHGTGREMFVGFLIAYGAIITFYIFYFALLTSEISFIMQIILPMLVIGFFFWLVPFAIFSSWRYRMSRTSWRGIFFSFNGRYSSFFRIYLGYFFLTLFTIGLGYPWLKVALQKKLFSHTSLGNMQMRFTGDGGTLFGINLLGYFLSYLTLGIYAPKWIKERLKFTVENTHLMDDYHSGSLTCHLRYGQAFEILFSNLLLLIFTVGLAYPFTHMRYLKMIFSNIELPAELNYDNIQQVAASRAEATGDQLFDILDLDIDF